jgi:hypothetical protein
MVSMGSVVTRGLWVSKPVWVHIMGLMIITYSGSKNHPNVLVFWIGTPLSNPNPKEISWEKCA